MIIVDNLITSSLTNTTTEMLDYGEQNILLLIRTFLFNTETSLLFVLPSLRLTRWPISIHITPMPPQTQEVSAYPVQQCWWTSLHQPASLPSKCQGIPNRYGPCSKDSQEAGQFLQCHHLQQQANCAVRTSPPKGI